MNTDGEPADLHDTRCAVWTSPHPDDTCTCRTTTGHTVAAFTAGVEQLVARYESYRREAS